MHDIFNVFKTKVLNPSYLPATPLEALKARLTAAWLLQDEDQEVREEAKEFMEKTSLHEDLDLFYFLRLSSQIRRWDSLQICSSYTNISGNFLEYKLTFTTVGGINKTDHFHALFESKNQVCYFVSQTPPMIRVIGDSILHQPGIPFPKMETATTKDHQELKRQIELAKELLVKTGGAGIAANQCAAIEKPFSFTIVGVFYEIPEQVEKVTKRYPTAKFPQATIMVNPVITSMSQETQNFNHACLSVPCGNRCAVKSPMEITVRFQDFLDKMQVKQMHCKGTEAVVLWHELTHILDGKTYMDVTFEALSLKHLSSFQQLLDEELQKRHHQSLSEQQIPELTVPPFYLSVTIGPSGEPQLDTNALNKALINMTEETLAGLSKRANQLIKKKTADFAPPHEETCDTLLLCKL
jgi:peptide deformylase